MDRATTGWVGSGRSAWAASGYAAGQVLLAVPLVLLASAWLLAAAFCLVGVGVYAVRALVPAVSGIAATHRLMLLSILERPVPLDLPEPDLTLGPVRQVRAWLATSQVWRELAWMGYALTGGFVLSALPLLIPAITIPLVVVPLVLTASDSTTGTLVFLVLGITGAVVLLGLWWRFSWPLVHLRAQTEAPILAPDGSAELRRRVLDLARTRAASVDAAAGELRRIERDLHDGAQVRLVAIALQLGMAEDALAGVAGPVASSARALVREARGSTTQALADVRDVVRGIHPPLLADRGLVGAVEAVVGDLPLRATLDLDLEGRPPAAVESAIYFATTECLANVVRHAGATRVDVRLSHDGSVLRTEVRDDGCGGANAAGSGLAGIKRRLEAFDGTLAVSSEVGGPTVITMEVPCALSSARTTPS